MSETLIIFSRYPEAGKTKTRMIPVLGAVKAAKLQQQMSEHTLNTVRSLQAYRRNLIEVHFIGGNQQLMKEWLGSGVEYIEQVPGDLGFKMYSAFERAFSLNNQRVIIIGTDCPDIDLEILNDAFEALHQQDLVLGAAVDGGYYLIGLNNLNNSIAQLFENINWGTAEVFTQTQTIAAKLNLKVHYLPCLSDVDRPEDLCIWQKYSDFKTEKLS